MIVTVFFPILRDFSIFDHVTVTNFLYKYIPIKNINMYFRLFISCKLGNIGNMVTLTYI